MKSPKRSKPNLIRSSQTLLGLALIASIAWLSHLYPLRMDITANANHTLSEASQRLLKAMPEPITITAYLPKGLPVRLQISQLLEQYQQRKSDILFQFIDPDSQPDKTRELAIGPEGVVLVEYRGHSEKLAFVDESTLSNALLQLAHAQQRWVSFLTGHGERAPDGIANFAWGQFGKELTFRHITSQPLDLATVGSIPDNSAVLVIAAPTVALLPGEIALIKRYLDQGGNAWLLGEPDNNHLQVLLTQLGIQQHTTPIIDTSTRLYGVDDPSFVIASIYPPHPLTRGLQLISLYPITAALSINANSPFQSQALLTTSGQNPSTFAYTLTRNLGKTQQRIVVMGDSDFLSNTYLSNVGNVDVGLRITNWLLHNDEFIDIPAKAATDKQLNLTAPSVAIMGFGFLLGMPLLLVVIGIVIWRRRKQY